MNRALVAAATAITTVVVLLVGLNQFRIEGPAVAQMQSAFIDNWLQTTGEALDSAHYLPSLAAAGSSRAQVFTSSPGGGAESMQLMFPMSIASAAESIRISASYFVPDEAAVQSFVAARRSGVRVQVLLPGPHMDMPFVRRASRTRWEPLLEAGGTSTIARSRSTTKRT